MAGSRVAVPGKVVAPVITNSDAASMSPPKPPRTPAKGLDEMTARSPASASRAPTANSQTRVTGL